MLPPLVVGAKTLNSVGVKLSCAVLLETTTSLVTLAEPAIEKLKESETVILVKVMLNPKLRVITEGMEAVSPRLGYDKV